MPFTTILPPGHTRLRASASITEFQPSCGHENEIETSEAFPPPGDGTCGLEPLSNYRPGGYHPVHLGDKFGTCGQYIIDHKLGSGRSSTIWLCHKEIPNNGKKHYALKIFTADFANVPKMQEMRAIHNALRFIPEQSALHVCLPITTFFQPGPNGRHLCYILPVLGPTIIRGLGLLNTGIRDSSFKLRTICAKVVKTLARMQECGLHHGSLKANHILQDLTAFRGDDDQMESLREPERFVLSPVAQYEGRATAGNDPRCGLASAQNTYVTHIHADGKIAHKAHAPTYLVHPVRWENVPYIADLEPEPCLIDFSMAWEKWPQGFAKLELIKHDPTYHLYMHPHVLMESPFPLLSNIEVWALGAVLFEIRTGANLLRHPYNGSYNKNSYLYQIAHLMRHFPVPMDFWSRWRDIGDYFLLSQEGISDISSRHNPCTQFRIDSLENYSKAVTPGGQLKIVNAMGDTNSPHTRVRVECLREKINQNATFRTHDGHIRKKMIGNLERRDFEDFLRKMLYQNDQEKLVPSKVLEHPWLDLRSRY